MDDLCYNKVMLNNTNTKKNLNLNALTKEELIALLEQEMKKSEMLADQYDSLLEQIKLANKKIYGSSSETAHALQLDLFNEAEVTVDTADAVEEVSLPVVAEEYNRAKKKKARKPSDVHELKIVEVIHDVEEEDKAGYLRCGEKVREELCFQPAHWYIKKHIYPMYKADLEDGSTDFRHADGYIPLIEKSYLSSELAAFVMNEKYNRGLPLYRIEENFVANDVAITRQTLSNWCMQVADHYFSFLIDRMKLHLLTNDIVHCDETSLQVLHHQDGSTNKNSYMWVYCSGMYDKPIRLYVYEPDRSGDHAKDYLSGYRGYVVTDGYQGYNKVEYVTRVGCLAHARRGFTEALSAYDKTKNTSQTKAMLEEIIKDFGKIFSLEKIAEKLDLEKKQQYRDQSMKPLLIALKEKLIRIEDQILPSSKFGKAITYFLNQYKHFENIFLDPRLELTNNVAERAIKPFVIGRKAWLFSNTTSGALSSATLYSIVQTAKENDLNVEKYLTYVLEEMRGKKIHDQAQFDYLLPYSDSLPDHVRFKKKSQD